ncbi:MAG: hypothetical protein WDN75_10860 [Bacteroidota bacterium]
MSAKSLASEFGYTYAKGASTNLKEFFTSSGTVKILELETSQSHSKEIFEEFKKQINQRYEP